MSSIETAVHGVVQAYRDAVAAKDAAALLRLYHPRVRLFDAFGVWSHEGLASWQATVEGWFSSLGDERATATFDDLDIAGDAGFALVTAIVTYAGFSANGEPLRSLQNRLTWGIDLKSGAPRIVHEHTSAPIGFEDMKAILQRTPTPAA